jgi:MOSC domain-containing protein YiiM
VSVDLVGRVHTLSTGTVGELRYGKRSIATAFVKAPVEGRVRLGTLGFPDDEHVYWDHGGPDKAALVYPFEHYAHWRALGFELPDAGAFGENLTVTGLVERDVHLGDVFEIGTSVVQVSQPRSPCYKIAARYGRKELSVLAQDFGLIGYLLRVLTEGEVGAGDDMRLVERDDHGVTVAEAGRVVNVDRADLDAARRVLSVATLGSSARRILTKRIDGAGDGGLDNERLFLAEDAPRA